MEFTKEDEELFERAVEKWGLKAQTDMGKEECAELIVALSHFERERVGLDGLVEELADVRIMFEQLRKYFGPEMIDEKVEEKMGRLEERLNE